MKSQIFLFIIFIFFGCKTEELNTIPIVTTSSVSNIQQKAVVLNGDIKSDGFSKIKEKGFVYSEVNTNPTLNDNKVDAGSGLGTFNSIISNLKPNTKYYYKSYGINSTGTGFGEIMTFLTLDYNLATITSSSASDLTRTSVKLTGILNDDGGGVVSERGFCVSKSPNPTIKDLKFPVDNIGLGQYSLIVIKLEANTKYFYKSYSINEKGTNYGNEQSFSTLDYTVPRLNTGAVENISQTSGSIPIEIIDDGGLAITEKGLLFSYQPQPTLNDSKIQVINSTNKYSAELKNLNINSKIYCRAYAINSKGVGYGNEVDFSLLITHKLTVMTTVRKLTNNEYYPTVGVKTIDKGELKIEALGIVVGYSPLPTVENNIHNYQLFNRLQDFEYLMAIKYNGEAYIKYYIRAYATNSKERVYGNEITYTTEPGVIEKLGGIVAYVFEKEDIGYVEGEEHGYIMSKKSLGIYKYGCSGKNLIGAESDNGKQNTIDILNDCNELNIAAKICSDYTVTEGNKVYDDWFLPSRKELSAHFKFRNRPNLNDYFNIHSDNMNFRSGVQVMSSKEWTQFAFDGISMSIGYDVQSGNPSASIENINGAKDELYYEVIAFRRY